MTRVVGLGLTTVAIVASCARTGLDVPGDLLDGTMSDVRDDVDAAGGSLPSTVCDASSDVLLLVADGGQNWAYGDDGGVIIVYAVTCCGGRICDGFCMADGGCACGNVPGSCAPLHCCLASQQHSGPSCESCFGGPN